MQDSSVFIMATKKDGTSSSFDELVEKIEGMTVLELAEFIKALEEKLGVSVKDLAMPVASGAPQGGAAVPAEVEKTSFNVVLKEIGASKIQVIKVVKDVTGKGLTEAKDIVEKAPIVVKEGVKKEEAEELKKKLEAAGAVVSLD